MLKCFRVGTIVAATFLTAAVANAQTDIQQQREAARQKARDEAAKRAREEQLRKLDEEQRRQAQERQQQQQQQRQQQQQDAGATTTTPPRDAGTTQPVVDAGRPADAGTSTTTTATDAGIRDAGVRDAAAPRTDAAAPTAADLGPAPLPPTDLEELIRTRPDRRKASLERAKRRWGELIRDDKAKTELTLHGKRVASLQRIRALATKAKDQKLIVRVDELLTKEETRHSDAMNAVRSGAAK